MKGSIQHNFLVVCSALVIVTIAGLSGAYYVQMKRKTHRESRERIRIAFDLLLDGFVQQFATFAHQTEDFLARDASIARATSSYGENPQQLQSIKFIINYLLPASEKLKLFGQNSGMNALSVYGSDKRLLILYTVAAMTPETVGGYVQTSTGENRYLPFDDPTLLASLSMRGAEIPDTMLPEGGQTLFPEDIPQTITTTMLTRGTKLILRVIAPVFYNKKLNGVLVGESIYPQSTVAYAASLTRTAINVYAGDQLSVGTLPAQPRFITDASLSVPTCDDLRADDVQQLLLQTVTVENQTYYQGQCRLTVGQTTIGAITVNLSQVVTRQELRRLQVVILIIASVMLGLTVSISWVLSRHPARAVQRLITMMSALADGDLRQTATAISHDEFGVLTEHINQMSARLRLILGQIQRSGIQVTSSSTELAATAKQQEVTMRQQVESTQQVLNAIQEITDMITEFVQTMHEVAVMSQESADFATSGKADLERMQQAMQQMETESKTISGRLQLIHEKTANITSVVTTITKVADQTNLLSLNAAIEAEKAGEYGRGFTVVAREIRRLADQTAVATLDIEQMVKEMQTAVSTGVTEMDTFILAVQQNAEDVERISQKLSRIIEQVQALSPRFESVNTAMNHQSDQTQAIDVAMQQLNEEMRQTLQSLQESFLAIAQLNEAAQGLQTEMLRFKVS